MITRDKFDAQISKFRSRLRIDRYSLDDDIEKHPELYLEIQEQYSTAVSMKDEAKTNAEAEYAKASLKMRKKFSGAADKKWTESQVKDEVLQDPDYTEAVDTLQEAEYRARVLGAMVASYDQRGKMLRELVQLYVSGYFVLRSAGKAKTDEISARAEAGREALAETRRMRLRARQDSK